MPNETLQEPKIAPEVIKSQLKRIQSSPHFSHSRRYPNFLNYVVLKTLDGQQDQLKERTIGIEAFGRLPGYDLNEDPIVRVTAGEVRKRLAQYYYEAGHQEEVRIELHPGSYIPDFKFVTAEIPEKPPTPAPTTTGLPAQTLPLPVKKENPPRRFVPSLKISGAKIVLALGVLAVAIGLVSLLLRPSPLDEFWRPVINSSSPVLISVGSVMALLDRQPTASGGSNVGDHPLYSDPVALADTIAISSLQQILSNHNKVSSIESSAETTFSDLQRGPVILVSGFNNPWTMRLTDPLHFRFLRPTLHEFEIQDRGDPDNKKWAINTLIPFSEMNRDFGLIARFHDPTTDQIIVVSAGLGENGTIAASQLLSTEKYFKELRQEQRMPKPEQNFEAVIETEIINGRPGPPRIVATYLW
ncbi:MAG: hypothetical protein ABR907_15200 [Terracidiphilus sp.]|jgi:hypothetical protein